MTEQLEQEILETREHLADTVDALTSKVEAGGKRAVKIGVPLLVIAVVGVVLWRRHG